MKTLYALVLITFLVVGGAAYADGLLGPAWLARAREPGVSALQRKVYEQLARVNSLKLPVDVPGGVMWGPGMHKDNPLSIIYNLGIDTVPVLAEALEDDTPTRTTLPSWNGNRGSNNRPWSASDTAAALPDSNESRDGSRPWRVCDAAGMVIRSLTEREFGDQ